MQETSPERYDVVIVGAGIAGLNALFVAAEHLGPSGRIALVDRRPRVGGMWNDTYDYVRLHQPHPIFTVGNIKWQWNRDPSYLPTKPEVLAHLEHCYDVIRQRATVTEFLGWEYDGHEEVAGVVRTAVVGNGERVVLESPRLVKALAFDVPTNQPLELSSDRVRSVSPDYCDMRSPEMAASTDPVWIVGGGKTGMDTAHTLITTCPGREVNLLAGSGTVFSERSALYPTRNRLIRGTRPLQIGVKATRVFDGTNEAEMNEFYKSNWGTWVSPKATNWLSGILSEGEAETIRNGLNLNLNEHLADAVDAGNSVELVLRSGERLRTSPGAWIVNCTGYLFKGDAPYEPYSSASGRVLSINGRSSTLLYSHLAGYFMTHLLFRDKLATAELYELDVHALRQHTNAAVLIGLSTLMHNFGVLLGELPTSVFLKCGLDFDRMYPEPRHLIGALRLQATYRRDRPHLRRALASVRERYGVRSGPLDFSADHVGGGMRG